jgi:hypothetical protein
MQPDNSVMSRVAHYTPCTGRTEASEREFLDLMPPAMATEIRYEVHDSVYTRARTRTHTHTHAHAHVLLLLLFALING